MLRLVKQGPLIQPKEFISTPSTKKQHLSSTLAKRWFKTKKDKVATPANNNTSVQLKKAATLSTNNTVIIAKKKTQLDQN